MRELTDEQKSLLDRMKKDYAKARARAEQRKSAASDTATDFAPLTNQQIDAVLEFLPKFQKADCEYGEWVFREGAAFPWCNENELVSKLIRTLYDQNIIVKFDWAHWGERKAYETDHNMLGTASILQLRKLLTTYARGDRFTEGLFISRCSDGMILAILERLQVIRNENDAQ